MHWRCLLESGDLPPSAIALEAAFTSVLSPCSATTSNTVAQTLIHKKWAQNLFHQILNPYSVHYREKYTPQGPRDFARAGILHPEARGQSRGPRYNQCNAMHHIALWWHFACLQMSTLYLSTSFSAQGCVPDICPRECIKNTVPSTLPREQGVYWIL